MLESDRNCNFKMTLVKWRATVSCMLLFTSLALITTSSQQQLQFSGMSACMLIYYSCTTTSTPTVIVAANSSSTLITTLTLGATDTSSSVELVHNVPPAVYTTNASTLVSAGYFLYLDGALFWWPSEAFRRCWCQRRSSRGLLIWKLVNYMWQLLEWGRSEDSMSATRLSIRWWVMVSKNYPMAFFYFGIGALAFSGGSACRAVQIQ